MKTHKMSPMMRQKVLQIIMFCVFKYVKACCSLGSNEVSQQDSATTVMMGKYGQQDDSDCDDYCCSTENKCEKGQGHCEKHEECKSNLRCGEHNCKEGKKLRNENNCCTDICRGWNNCCSKERPCGLGEGNCKTNADCIPTLICGEAGNSCNKTTDFQVNDRCCIRPTTTPTTCKRGYCCEKKPCNLNEGICAAHNQCLGNLLCGKQNCKHKKRGLLSTDRCCRAPTCGTADEDKCEKGWGCNFKDEECRANMYCVEKAKLIEQKINPSCLTDKKFENIKACCYPGCFHRNITAPFEDCCTKEKPCKGYQGHCRNDKECAGESICLKKGSCPKDYKKTARCCSDKGRITYQVTNDPRQYTPEPTTPMPEEEKILIIGGQVQNKYKNETIMTKYSLIENITWDQLYKCENPRDFPYHLQNSVIGLIKLNNTPTVLVCGGESTALEKAFKQCYYYAKMDWHLTTPLLTAKTSLYSTQSSFGLTIAGGHPVSSDPIQSLEIFYGDKWTTIDEKLFPVGHWGGCSCQIVENTIAFINGYNGSDNRYYFGINRFPETLAPIESISNIFLSFTFPNVTNYHSPTNLARLYPACGTVKRKLYVIGGYTQYYRHRNNMPKGYFTEFLDIDTLSANWIPHGEFGKSPKDWWYFFTTVKRNYYDTSRSLNFILLFEGEYKGAPYIYKFDGENFQEMRIRNPKYVRTHSSAMLISAKNLGQCTK